MQLAKGPRAFAVTKTGEKHLIPLEVDNTGISSLNTYTIPRSETTSLFLPKTVSEIPEEFRLHSSLSETGKRSRIFNKFIRKSKVGHLE